MERIGVTYNAHGQPDIKQHHIEQLAQMALMALEASVQRTPSAYTNGAYRNQYQQQGVSGQSPQGAQWQPTTTVAGNASIADPLQMATDSLFDTTPATTQSPQVVTSGAFDFYVKKKCSHFLYSASYCTHCERSTTHSSTTTTAAGCSSCISTVEGGKWHN